MLSHSEIDEARKVDCRGMCGVGLRVPLAQVDSTSLLDMRSCGHGGASFNVRFREEDVEDICPCSAHYEEDRICTLARDRGGPRINRLAPRVVSMDLVDSRDDGRLVARRLRVPGKVSFGEFDSADSVLLLAAKRSALHPAVVRVSEPI